ncbi:MAG: hypothetical protein M1832_004683 [Thelocarpon impressellum]|nr:MAG: hypothetical protein M1832_004683 [Thelocarpon impressellum]
MKSSLRQIPRVLRSSKRPSSGPVPPWAGPIAPYGLRPFSAYPPRTATLDTPRQATQDAGRGPPRPPSTEHENLSQGQEAPTFLGTTKRNPEYNMADKVVLVSGAGRGLGLTQAEALLEAGATVYALDRLEEPAEEFAEIQRRAKEELGTELHYRRIDVRDVDSLNKTVEDIAEKHGRLDGLIAAAGVNQETPALDFKAEDVNKLLEINITGVMMTAVAVARPMIRFGKGGSIALIASMSGTVANKGLICAPYNASKSAVLQLARNLASEWGEHGIRVNTISPGYILTAMVEELFVDFPERKTEWPQHNMLGRFSNPREYRGAAVFLLSEASSFMTGSDLRIDGGHAAW